MARFPDFDERVSDGCTGVRDIALPCCVWHDRKYWYGRTWLDKIIADLGLMFCIWGYGIKHSPVLSWPGFFLLGIWRCVGVLVLPRVARAFWNKPHKRGIPRAFWVLLLSLPVMGCQPLELYGAAAIEHRKAANDLQARGTMASICDISLGAFFRELTATERDLAAKSCGGDQEAIQLQPPPAVLPSPPPVGEDADDAGFVGV